MCTHSNTRTIGSCKCCADCGMVILPNGNIYFDRKLVSYMNKKKKGDKKRDGKK